MLKICSKCKVEKELTEFSYINVRKCYTSWCKKCSSEDRLKRYYADKSSHRKYDAERKIKVKNYINSHKIKCINCDETENICLDFHHKDPNIKKFHIGQQGITKSWKLIDEEIKKCVVICSNCHRKLHAGLIKLSD